jgi:alkylated DNA nucleotide flippase Atl1
MMVACALCVQDRNPPVSVVWCRIGPMSEESAGYAAGEPGPYAEKVLDTVDLIPPGRVMTYGDVAEWLDEGGPRQVGRVMALYGAGVPWWRVVRSDGVPLPGHELAAIAAYRSEGTPLRQAGPAAEGHIPRVDVRRARWDGHAPDAAPGGGGG